jgi:hypothetical protein
MDEKRPAKLFKYRKIDIKSVQCLAFNVIWCASPQSFNDPYDCAYRVDLNGMTIAEKEDFIRKMARRIRPYDNPNFGKVYPRQNFQTHEEMSMQIVEETISQVWGVCSFSADPKNCPSNITMWGHYADSHKGMCLEFSTAEGCFSRAREVIYGDEIPAINREKFIEGDDEEHKKAFLRKYVKWKDEEEWRYLHPDASIQYSYLPKQLTGIYFGARVTDDDAELVRRVMGRNATAFYIMEMVPHKYELKPRRLGPGYGLDASNSFPGR